MVREYLTKKDILNFAIESTLIVFGFTGTLIIYYMITSSIIIKTVTIIFGAIFGIVIVYLLNKVKKQKDKVKTYRDIIILVNKSVIIISLPFAIIYFLSWYCTDFKVPLLATTSTLLGAGCYCMYLRFKRIPRTTTL